MLPGIAPSQGSSSAWTEDTDKFTHPERVYVRRIFVAAGSDALEREKAQAKLDELITEVRERLKKVDMERIRDYPWDETKGSELKW
jgi:hypothetical protein